MSLPTVCISGLPQGIDSPVGLLLDHHLLESQDRTSFLSGSPEPSAGPDSASAAESSGGELSWCELSRAESYLWSDHTGLPVVLEPS